MGDLLTRRSERVSRIIFHVGDRRYANASMPAGRYLVASGQGNFEDTGPIYERLFDYVEKHGIKVIGCSYEERLIDETATKERDIQRIQVQIQIE